MVNELHDSASFVEIVWEENQVKSNVYIPLYNQTQNLIRNGAKHVNQFIRMVFVQVVAVISRAYSVAVEGRCSAGRLVTMHSVVIVPTRRRYVSFKCQIARGIKYNDAVCNSDNVDFSSFDFTCAIFTSDSISESYICHIYVIINSDHTSRTSKNFKIFLPKFTSQCMAVKYY